MERGMTTSPRIDLDRLLGRLDEFNRIGALPGGGNCRLALSDEDRAGRDLLVRWMRDLGLTVTVDAIGNIIGVRGGREDLAPVMFGSHIDTVGTGGRYDGLYGVLAGLEACEAINDAGRATRRPLALVAFTNEEGSRFPPYAMGSLVYVGGLAVEDAYAVRGIDGATVGEELRRIGYVGAARPGFLTPHAYLELHIEQGPVLESQGVVIGAVEGITGLSWTEAAITGRAAHAGTTPMHLRRDAAWAASEIAERAVLTIDLRNTDEALLQDAERQLAALLDRLAAQEQVAIATRSLARFSPVSFPNEMVSLIEATAR